MRSIARAFAAASIVLLGAVASHALEANLPPVLLPVEPAPGVLQPSMITLVGKANLRAGGEKNGGRYAAQLNYDLEAQTFALAPLFPFEEIFYGRLSPRGKSGRKFTLFLDDASHDAFTELFSKLAQVLITNTDPEAVLADSTELVLTLDENGVPSLKIKSRVLTQGFGEVVFKANTTQGELPE
jgi:hypothetical protein